MRYLCLVLVLVGAPLSAVAQQDSRRRPEQVGPGSIGLPLPPTGLPPLPTRRVGNATWERAQPPSWERPQTPSWERPQPPAWERQAPPPWEHDRVARPAPTPPRRNLRPRSQVVYVVMPNGNPMAMPWFPSTMPQVVTTASSPVVVAPRPLTGRLRLEVEPAALLQVFVDGVYVGTHADIGDGIELRPGARRIEIRAPGYQALTFDAQIDEERAITYRGALERLAGTSRPEAPLPAPVAPIGSKTMYVIPGCYMGNVSPVEMKLPTGCDISRMTTYTP